MSIAHWIRGWSRLHPSRPALHFEGVDYSYRAFERVCLDTVRDLKAYGISYGDRVAYLGPNRPELLALLFAAADLGALFLPLNWRLAPQELAYILRDAKPAGVYYDPEFRAVAQMLESDLGSESKSPGVPRAWRDIGPNPQQPSRDHGDCVAWSGAGKLSDPVLLVYTAGTTGRPKGAVLTQDALTWNAINASHAHDLTSQDHVLTDLPMFHVGGLNIQTLPALHAGAQITLHRRFNPERALADLVRRKPTLYLMVPATITALIEQADWAGSDLSSLRLVMTGSSNVPPVLLDAFLDRDIAVGQIYGSTEMAPVAVYLRAEDARDHKGSCGKPAVHCDIRVVDRAGVDVGPGVSGELWIKGPNLMQGYWQNQEATEAAFTDGWFHSGDVGHIDNNGFVYIDDRLGDVIISGGEQIYPAELENELHACPEILEAAVVGYADPRWVELPAAIVVPRDGQSISKRDVVRLFEGRLARYKHPRRVLFRDHLPRNAMGKVLKHQLRAWLKEQLSDG